MRKKFLVAAAGAALLSAGISEAAPKPSTMYVQVRASVLRSRPQFWSPPVGELAYGDSVTAMGAAPKDKSWIQAKFGDKEGFVHVSAVTSRKVILKPDSGSVQKFADPSTAVLAGKGFNNQVEGRYAASKGLDYKVVDEVEQLRVTAEEGASFVKGGHLAE